MEKAFKILSFLLLIHSMNCYVSYRNYKLYDVTPNAQQHELLSHWQYEEGVDFFRFTRAGATSKVLISPARVEEFEKFLNDEKISFKIVMDDYEKALEEERMSIAENHKNKRGFDGRTGDFSIYWTYDEMEAYSFSLATRFPNLVQIETLTFSPENRRIYGLGISNGVFGQKPIITIESGMHAREWAGPPTVFYLMHKLVEDPVTRNELLAQVDWLIVPMQNPDGYHFSWTDNRLWRQNRRQITPTCIGADLNRNWEFSWRAATITQPCGSLTFPGPFPFSEPENFYYNQLIARYNSQIKLFVALHTFGDLVLFPWSFNTPPFPFPNTAQHLEVGERFRQAILQATGTDYLVINTMDFFGSVNGGAHDHMIGANNVTIAHSLELTDGSNDFRFPEHQVLQLSEETFIGYRAYAAYVAETFA